MVHEMKKEQFEELLFLHGSDIALWPEQYRAQATALAETKVGKGILESELALDSLFEASAATGHAHIEDRNLNAFLARLEDIPSQHVQVQVKQPSGWFAKLQAFLAGMEIELSPAALASQMAVLVLALGMGIVVGFNTGMEAASTEDAAATEFDISDQWFTDDSDIGQTGNSFGE